GVRLPRSIAAIMFAIGFVLLALSVNYECVVVAASLVVAGVMLLDVADAIPFLRLPHLLGDSSYSIYLVHPIVLSPLGKAWLELHMFALPFGTAGYILFAASLSLCAGVALYRWVELPMASLLRPSLGKA